MRTNGYGSFFNAVMHDCKPAVPEVGMGATELMYSDRVAYTITEVAKSGNSFSMQRDTARRTDGLGMTDAQEYEYTPNPEGRVVKVTLRRDGRWRIAGSAKGCGTVLVGSREQYHDYTF